MTTTAKTPLHAVRDEDMPDDPAVAAYREWLAANEARHAFDMRNPDAPDDDAALNALIDAEDAAVLKMANTVPTTPEGAAG